MAAIAKTSAHTNSDTHAILSSSSGFSFSVLLLLICKVSLVLQWCHPEKGRTFGQGSHLVINLLLYAFQSQGFHLTW